MAAGHGYGTGALHGHGQVHALADVDGTSGLDLGAGP